MSHRLPVRIYYEDTDAGGIAYHANYLRWAERGRTEALRDAGITHRMMIAQFGAILVVRKLEVEYLRPARLDDLVEVETRVMKIAGASVRLQQDVLLDGQVLAKLVVQLACVDAVAMVARPLPGPFRDALAQLEEPTKA